MGVLGWSTMLVYNLVLMIVATLLIASITLFERKLLALLQRRVGPNFVGYKGRLQYLADALKLLTKNVIVPTESSRFWFVFAPAFAGAVCYSFWVNSIWGPSLSIFDIEYNIVYASILSVLFGLCLLLAGYFSKNKYAALASIRCGLMMANLEILLGLMLLNVVIVGESFTFSAYVVYQEGLWLILTFANMSAAILITFLLEVSRTPFDLAEAESELVAGYSTEYGGFYFALFYLGEYFHLFFFSMVISTLFLGGWEWPLLFFYIKPAYLLIF